jgi:hypothetical protein
VLEKKAARWNFLAGIIRSSTTISLVLKDTRFLPASLTLYPIGIRCFSTTIRLLPTRIRVATTSIGLYPEFNAGSPCILWATIGFGAANAATRSLGSESSMFRRAFRSISGRGEQQLSRLRAIRVLQIQPTASNIVTYRSRVALRYLLHGFLPEPEGWVLLEQQSVSVEVETSIYFK